eukprot:scaffold185195_cov23-Tisochrysis_lutea.AAC.2
MSGMVLCREYMSAMRHHVLPEARIECNNPERACIRGVHVTVWQHQWKGAIAERKHMQSKVQHSM